MIHWLNTFIANGCSDDSAVLVTVESIRGSTPREKGAAMLVFREQFYGTIGGGNLEFQALKLAREQLATRAPDCSKRFPLAASLGQCCGGWVTLSFKRVIPDQAWCEGYLQAQTGQPDVFNVLLFGAGHVGTALVNVLQTLPCHITWVDEREACFPSHVPGNVTFVSHDDPVAEIQVAPEDSYCLIMTHNHTLDYELVTAALKRPFPYLGLIGSHTKRRSFEQRLIHRQPYRNDLARLTCPIGLEGISGKQPEVIAVSVAAQLLQQKRR